MNIRYDDDFLEAAVFLCASGRRAGAPPAQIRRFHVERERCYAVADPDERNAAFFKVHLEWFREWGFEQLLLSLLKEYPLLSGALNVLAFRQARGKNEDGAELYVSAGNVRNAVVALRMDRLQHDEPLLCFLRHEYMHLHDMVNPAFGYSPQVHLPSHNQTQQRITRERYRLLWDITIDGRLSRTGLLPSRTRDHHDNLFQRAFSFWTEAKRRDVFQSYWDNDAPRHEQLLALASDPRDLGLASAPLPGSSCPLCCFPTFQWADIPTLAAETLAKVSAAFPLWHPSEGACSRCIEIYELMDKHEWPDTVER